MWKIESDFERGSTQSNRETQATGKERAWQEPRRGDGRDPEIPFSQSDRGQRATDCGEKQVRGLGAPQTLGSLIGSQA